MAARRLLLAAALLPLAGCYHRVEVPLASPGGAVACFGEDHLFGEPQYSGLARHYCVAQCRSAGFAAGPALTDLGGITPRLNPGVPYRCL